jgi:hypothetical protein
MCTIYSIYAIFWIICSLYYWRDLLRIQIWIGGVIFLGLMEKAAYLGEYDSIERNGYSGCYLTTYNNAYYQKNMFSIIDSKNYNDCCRSNILF